MTNNPYLEAVRAIPAGETRSFRELAALAGRPAAARAAGRAVAACAVDDRRPWHRIVASDGALAKDPDRARAQLERLRREGARPKEGEPVARWVKRRRAQCVGDWRTRSFAPADDPAVSRWSSERLEALLDPARAEARGFRPLDARSVRSRTRRPVASESERTVARTVRSPRNASAPRSSRDASASGAAHGASRSRAEAPSLDVARRLDDVDWQHARSELSESGSFTIERALDARRCAALRGWLELSDLFERTVDMAPRGYGVGTYRYFKEPLPEPAFTLREEIYARLLPLARERELASSAPTANGKRRSRARAIAAFPDTLTEFFERCRAAGQRRGSSILLSYTSGGVNHPHRDIYGKLSFPYQAVLVLSARGKDFEGGDFLLCTRDSERAEGSATRALSTSAAPANVGASERQRTLTLDQGDLCIFAARGFRTSASLDLASRFEPGSKIGESTAGTPEPVAPKRASRRTRASERASSAARYPDRPLSRARSPDRESVRAPATDRWVEQTHGLTRVTRGTRLALGLVLHLAQ